MDNETTNETELEDEIIYEDAETPSEIVSIAWYSLSVAESYDYGMCSRSERKMIDEIKEMALKLTHQSIKLIYETNIEEGAE
jgi:hypothetical protein